MSVSKPTIRPATPEDKKPIYEWLAHSDITHLMIGPPTFPEVAIPSWEEFCSDFPEYFFNNSKPELGRCFIIEQNKEPIGQLCHDKIFGNPLQTELDIWLKSSEFIGKGFGTKALQQLVKFLKSKLQCQRFVISPSARNPWAIKSYQKAGFIVQKEIPHDYVPDYTDAVYMIRNS